MSRKCLYYISAYTRECVKIKEITRQHVKATKLLRVPFFVTMHHVHNFRKAASHAKSAAAIDFCTRLQGLCEAASAAMDKGNLSEFYAIRRTICPKQSSSLVSLHVDDKVLSCYNDIKQAFMSHFSSALADTNVDPSLVFPIYLTMMFLWLKCLVRASLTLLNLVIFFLVLAQTFLST